MSPLNSFLILAAAAKLAGTARTPVIEETPELLNGFLLPYDDVLDIGNSQEIPTTTPRTTSPTSEPINSFQQYHILQFSKQFLRDHLSHLLFNRFDISIYYHHYFDHYNYYNNNYSNYFGPIYSNKKETQSTIALPHFGTRTFIGYAPLFNTVPYPHFFNYQTGKTNM